jgi:hypothetical protein
MDSSQRKSKKESSSSGFRAYRSSNTSTNLNSNLTNVNAPTNVKRDLESTILASTAPLDMTETEEITVNGERGIWINRNEVTNWRGNVPISKYPINDDPNPEIIRKRTNQQIVYHQEVAIRYLRPPTPPPPGEILIQQVGISLPPAPPLVIRQQPPKPVTPPPLVVREAPPPPPQVIGRKGNVTIYHLNKHLIFSFSGSSMPVSGRFMS